MFVVLFFFFKQKTAYEMRISDWSSDVCSSDLDTTEDAKARRLQNHLFLDLPGVAADHDLRRTTAAERIRADLADLVPFGAGLYLVREDAIGRASCRDRVCQCV